MGTVVGLCRYHIQVIYHIACFGRQLAQTQVVQVSNGRNEDGQRRHVSAVLAQYLAEPRELPLEKVGRVRLFLGGAPFGEVLKGRQEETNHLLGPLI